MSRLDDLARLMLAVLNDEQEPEDAPMKAAKKVATRRRRKAKNLAAKWTPPIDRSDMYPPALLVLNAEETDWFAELPVVEHGPLRRRGPRDNVRGNLDASGWSSLRNRVWERDAGVCFVCRREVGDGPGEYECGHIIERVAGGPDRMSNLVVMCLTCNRMKGIHPSREEFVRWMGGFRRWMASGCKGESPS